MFLWYPVLDLARAPRRTARKKGSGYENGWLHTLFIIGGLVPNLEFSRENVKNICKNKYNFFSLKSEPQVMFILMF